MRAITSAGANGHDAATVAVVEMAKKNLADLDEYYMANLCDDVVMADLVGRLKALVGVLVAVIDTQ